MASAELSTESSSRWRWARAVLSGRLQREEAGQSVSGRARDGKGGLENDLVTCDDYLHSPEGKCQNVRCASQNIIAVRVHFGKK